MERKVFADAESFGLQRGRFSECVSYAQPGAVLFSEFTAVLGTPCGAMCDTAPADFPDMIAGHCARPVGLIRCMTRGHQGWRADGAGGGPSGVGPRPWHR